MLSYVSFLNPKLLLPSATRKCLNTSRFYVAFSSWRCGSASQTKFQASAAASSSTSLPPFANKLVFPPIDDIGDLAVDPWLLRWTSDRVKLKVDCPRLAKHIDTYQCISDVCHSLSLFNNIFTIFYTLSMLSMPLHRALTKEKCLMPDLPGTRPAKGFNMFRSNNYVQIIQCSGHSVACQRLLLQTLMAKGVPTTTNVYKCGITWLVLGQSWALHICKW